jgi:hypothetical protein
VLERITHGYRGTAVVVLNFQQLRLVAHCHPTWAIPLPFPCNAWLEWNSRYHTLPADYSKSVFVCLIIFCMSVSTTITTIPLNFWTMHTKLYAQKLNLKSLLNILYCLSRHGQMESENHQTAFRPLGSACPYVTCFTGSINICVYWRVNGLLCIPVYTAKIKTVWSKWMCVYMLGVFRAFRIWTKRATTLDGMGSHYAGRVWC